MESHFGVPPLGLQSVQTPMDIDADEDSQARECSLKQKSGGSDILIGKVGWVTVVPYDGTHGLL